MNLFINREAELTHLQNLYENDNGQLVILYGRRRLGKTRLLKEFCLTRPHTYFMADRAGEQSLKKALALAMAASLNEPLLQSVDYPEWYDLFEAFDRLRPPEQKVILILDEYQYICQVQPAFSSFIQKWWDEHWQHENIMLILCGSVTSMMYRETMAQSGPLYGRSTGQILLSPLVYREVPVLKKNPAKSKKGFYQVADPFLRLWFGTIFPYESFLEFGQIETIKERLQPQIKTHIAHCFEKLCRNYVHQQSASLNCLKVGRQWAGNYEIDVAGVTAEFKLNVVGECKWSRKKVGMSVYRELHDKVTKNNLPVTPHCKYLLFSRSGFTDELEQRETRDDNLLLVRSLFEPLTLS